MVGIDVLQAGFLAKLKANAAVLAITTDIRELEYQGRDFTYPNLRLRVVTEDLDETCSSKVQFVVAAFSEKDSSKQCMQLITAAANVFNDHQVKVASLFKTGRIATPGVGGPYRVDLRVWRSDGYFNCTATKL